MAIDALQVVKRQGKMESDRANFESHWQEIADRILPRQNCFNSSPGQIGGDKKTEKMFDSTACLALDRFAAAMESMLTPRTQKWHKLQPSNKKLRDNHEVRVYLEEVNEILFAVRYAPDANFASQMHEYYISLGAFGSGSVFIDDNLGRGIRYKSCFIGDTYFAENAVGQIDTIHRKFNYTARQAVQYFGLDNLPSKIKAAYKENKDDLFEFLHVVMPMVEVDRQLSMRQAHYSGYLAMTDKVFVGQGHYYTFPYGCGRYVTSPNDVYGRSPAMTALADIKMVNEMSKTILRAGQMATDPPLLLSEDGALRAFSLRPGALNYGGVDANGKQMVHPLITGARVDIGLDLQDQRRRAINDAFLITLFQILVEAPNMTATEALLRAQEKGALLAPTMGRQQSEMLGPIIQRELDILSRANAFPPMPRALIEVGGAVEIEYVSPLVRAQRADEGVAIMRTFEAIVPLAQIDPGVVDALDTDVAVRELAEINGCPEKIIRSVEEVKAIREKQAAQMQAQQLLAAAPLAGKAANDFASAGQKAGMLPSGGPAI